MAIRTAPPPSDVVDFRGYILWRNISTPILPTYPAAHLNASLDSAEGKVLRELYDLHDMQLETLFIKVTTAKSLQAIRGGTLREHVDNFKPKKPRRSLEDRVAALERELE